jgi:hypothetical protein
LGAGVTRLAAVKLDPHRRRWTFWAYLAGELGLGGMALSTALKRRSGFDPR